MGARACVWMSRYASLVWHTHTQTSGTLAAAGVSNYEILVATRLVASVGPLPIEVKTLSGALCALCVCVCVCCMCAYVCREAWGVQHKLDVWVCMEQPVVGVSGVVYVDGSVYTCVVGWV